MFPDHPQVFQFRGFKDSALALDPTSRKMAPVQKKRQQLESCNVGSDGPEQDPLVSPKMSLTDHCLNQQGPLGGLAL